MEVNGQLHDPVRMGEERKNLLPLLGCKPQIVQPEAYSLHDYATRFRPKSLVSSAQNSPLLFDLYFVLWSPPNVYTFKAIPRSEFENFCQI